MWAQLIQIVIARLQDALGDTATVQTVFDAEVPDTATVYVLRGGTSELSLYGERGTEKLLIGCWVQDDDPAAADLALQTLENSVIGALRDLPHSESVLGIAITGIDADGDAFRPVVSSMINLSIDWRTPP